MKLNLILALLVKLGIAIAQNETDRLVYLKIEDQFAPYPGITDFTTFKKHFPSFNYIATKYSIEDIKCVFKSKSKKIQSIYYLNYNINTDVNNLIKDLEQIDEVEYAEKPMIFTLSANINDPFYTPEQWNLDKIEASQAWDIYQNGSGYKSEIAVIDAGFVIHDDLWNNFWQNPNEIWNNGLDDDSNGFIDDKFGWDAANDDNNPSVSIDETDLQFGHGTFVSGFAGAVTNNGIGIASVSNNSSLIIPIKVGRNNLSNEMEIPAGSIPKAIDYAINLEVNIISMSLSSQWAEDLGSHNGRTLHEIIIEAQNMGILLVAAAGNNATYYSDISYPARFPEVIAVGSTDINDFKAYSSQFSTDIDIMAPGHNVFSTIQTAPWYEGSWSGTSFSTPTVSGALGLMKAFMPSATSTELKTCLFIGADNIETIAANTQYIGKLGHGRLNVRNSIICLQDLTMSVHKTGIPKNEYSIFPNPATNQITITSSNNLDINSYSIFNIYGDVILNYNNFTEKILNINVSTLPSGTYFIKINNLVKIFIKE